MNVRYLTYMSTGLNILTQPGKRNLITNRKSFPAHATREFDGLTSVGTLILKLSAKTNSTVKFTFRPFYPPVLIQ